MSRKHPSRVSDQMRRMVPHSQDFRRIKTAIETEDVKVRRSNRRAPLGWYWISIKIDCDWDSAPMWRMNVVGFFQGLFLGLKVRPPLAEAAELYSKRERPETSLV